MSASTFTVFQHDSIEPFDRITLNTDHRLRFKHGSLTAVYPTDVDEREYVVARFPVENDTVELPDGSAVLEATDDVTALVPADAYGGDR